MILQEGTLQFNFHGSLDAIKFDEPDSSSPDFHGLSHCMKAVDFVVEYSDYYLFIEVKDPPDEQRYGQVKDQNELIFNLRTKFRDTFLYRWAEKKLEKPIRFQCLIEMENALTSIISDQLKREIPITNLPDRWNRNLVELCSVTNLKTWNISFPDIPVTRV